MLRNGYPGFIQYGTFVTPNLSAWSGSTNDQFVDTYVDLSDWQGEDILLRFRFGTDDNTPGPLGWVIDDFEFMDMLTYNGQVCLTSAQGDTPCAIAPEEGTIVQSQEPNPNSTVEKLQGVTLKVYPNPANDQLNISLSSEIRKDVTISLLTVEGKEMTSRALNVYGNNHVSLNVSDFPSGFYFVKVIAADGVIVQKVIIE